MATAPIQNAPQIPTSSPGQSGLFDSLKSKTHPRSDSINSAQSIHPSVAESTNTESRLIPPAYAYRSLPPIQVKGRGSRPVPLEITSRNDLPRDQRAMLVKRTRKLEQILGQPLDETQIERLIIQPSTAIRTVTTEVTNDTWPDSPLQRSRVPEWAREDCVPRIIRGEGSPEGSRSISSVITRARAALGLAKRADGDETNLEVYVRREMRVSETAARGVAPQQNPSLASPNTPTSPADQYESEWLDEPENEDEATRRARRHQLAKVSYTVHPMS